MKRLAFCAAFAATIATQASAITLIWDTSVSQIGWVHSYKTKIAPSGNVFVLQQAQQSGLTGVRYLAYSSSGTLLQTSDSVIPTTYSLIPIDATWTGTATVVLAVHNSSAKVIDFDSAGHLSWQADINNVSGEQIIPIAIQADSTGSLYVACRHLVGGVDKSFDLVRYNSTGTKLWTRQFTGPSTDQGDNVRLYDMYVNAYDEAFLAGHYDKAATGTDPAINAGVVVWYSTTGARQRTRTYTYS